MIGLGLAAPVLFLAGSLVAGRAQPVGTYDPVGQTVSTLAGRGATDSWIMIGTLIGLGVAYLAVAVGLRAVPAASRLGLGVGAGGVLLTALARQPAHGTSAVHMTGMVVGAAAFTVWPLGLVADRSLPTGLRRESLVAVAAMVVGLGWLCAQAWTDGTWLGVAERTLVLGQTVWPLRVAVASGRRSRDGVVSGPHATLALALLPPLVFAVGLVVAQAAQPVADPGTWSLSALAAIGARQRWVMTATLGVIGTVYVAVAAGLRRLPLPARLLLGLGGAMLVVVALVPQHLGGTSAVHIAAGATAWAAFATWPLGVALSRAASPGLRRACALATGVLVLLLVWFLTQFLTGGPLYGPSERIVFAAQCLWPITLAAVDLPTRARRDVEGQDGHR